MLAYPPRQGHDEGGDVVRSVAVLGTGSDVGKSTIAAGLCRVFHRAGVRVAPFKAQNMSNNASPALLMDPEANSSGWGEIGTAQATQAEACGLTPRVQVCVFVCPSIMVHEQSLTISYPFALLP
jgi:predicted GTPase